MTARRAIRSPQPSMRIVFNFGISYRTPLKKVREINLQLMETLRDMDVQCAFPIRNVEFTGGDPAGS